MAKHVNFYTGTLNSDDTVRNSSNAEPGSIIIAKTSDTNPVARLYVKDPTGTTDNLFEIGSNVSTITTKGVTTGSLSATGTTNLGISGSVATFSTNSIQLKQNVNIADRKNLAVAGTTTTSTTVNIGGTGASVAKFESNKIIFKQPTTVSNSLDANTLNVGTSGSIATFDADSGSIAGIQLKQNVNIPNGKKLTVGNSGITTGSISVNGTASFGNNGSVATFSTDSGNTAGIQLKQNVALPSSKSLTAGTIGASTIGYFRVAAIGDPNNSYDIASFTDTQILLRKGTFISGVASFEESGISLAQNVDIGSSYAYKNLTVNGGLKVNSINAIDSGSAISTSSIINSNNVIMTTNELSGHKLTVGITGATKGTVATFDNNGIKLKGPSEVTSSFKISGHVDAMGNTKFYNTYYSILGNSITGLPSGLYFLITTITSTLGAVRSGCVIACPKVSNYGSRYTLDIGTSDRVYAKSSYNENTQRAGISIENLPTGYSVSEIVAYPLFIPCNNSGIEFNWA